jgi:hypothetical protein
MKTKLLSILVLILPALLAAQTLKLGEGAKATLGPQSYMTIGEITSDSPEKLIIKSSAEGSGSLIYVNQDEEPYATVEVWTGESGQWHFISPPTTNTIAEDFPIGGDQWAFLQWYDETVEVTYPPAPNQANGWTFVVSKDFPVNVGQGYAYLHNADNSAEETATVTFSGQLKSKTVSYGSLPPSGLNLLSYSGPPLVQFGWNLIGNPYSASIQEGIGSMLYNDNMEDAVWIWKGGDYNNYIVWRMGGGSENGEHPIIIPMGQAFFVHATGTGINGPNLVIPADNRAHNMDVPIYKKKAALTDNPFSYINIYASNNGAKDKIVIELANEDLNSEYERESISKFFGPSTSPQLYTVEGDRYLSILTFNTHKNERVIDLGYIPGAEGSQEFVTELSFPEGTEVYLEDLKMDIMHNLVEQPVYPFFASKSDKPERFRIHFSFTPDGIEDPADAENSFVHIYAWDKAVYIVNSENQTNPVANVYIFDLFGRQVYSGKIVLSSLTRIPVSVRNSYLMVRIIKEGKIYTEKVFVK